MKLIPSSSQPMLATTHKRTLIIVTVTVMLLMVAVPVTVTWLWATSRSTPPYQTWDIGEQVAAVVFSPDGQFVAVGTDSGQIQLRRVTDGDPVWSVKKDSYTVNTLAFSPDGRTLASGGNDGEAHLWRVQDGTSIRILPPQSASSRLVTLDFSPDGQILAMGTRGGRVNLWHMSNQQSVKTLSEPTERDNFITLVRFNEAGNILTVGNAKDVVQQWQTRDNSLIHTQEGYARQFTRYPVRIVDFNLGGDIVASTYYGTSEIYIWSLRSGQRIFTLETSYPWSLAFTPDGQLLASGEGNSEVDPVLPSLGLVPETMDIRIWSVSDGSI